ncbi:MAG: hypothetical protein KJO40_13485 [Deltaproteobacteria bacterium]|nr:hypothetical protein [Deltaproteobacteria bacterium]
MSYYATGAFPTSALSLAKLAASTTPTTSTRTTSTGRRTTPSAKTHVWCDNLTPPHWRRKRADGKNPCTAAPTGVTVRHTKSAQQLCREAGVPPQWLRTCETKVKAGIPVATAVAQTQQTASTAAERTREHRRGPIYTECRAAGVPEGMLEECYKEIKGGTPEQRGQKLQEISEQIAEEMSELAPDAGAPLPAAAAPAKFPMWILLAGGGALALVLLLKRRK